jgi:hypothetical protein
VPTIEPSSVSGASAAVTVAVAASDSTVFSVSLARPKSSNFTRPSSSIIMLAGLRSRCTIPAECARARASAIWIEYLKGRRSFLPINWWSVLPATNSMAMKSVSPDELMSYMWMMLG